MRLKDSKVLSELGRDIYSVRFLGIVEHVREDKAKIVARIRDGEHEIDVMAYPRISPLVGRTLRRVRSGDKVLVLAHLEPMNRICYADIVIRVTQEDEIDFYAGLFMTYFRLAFGLCGSLREDTHNES